MSIEALKAEYEKAAPDERQDVLSRIYQSLNGASKAELDAATKTLLPLMSVPSPNHGGTVAITLGALVELGADPSVLANAILAPLQRWLIAAARFSAKAVEFANPPDDAEEEDLIDLGDRAALRADVDHLYADDREAVAAWFALELWSRPAIASLTRAPEAFAAARENVAFREALRALGRVTGGAHWLRILFDASVGDRFVFLFPELKEAYELKADGIVDVGQLSVLISVVLGDPLSRISASGPADPKLIKLMLGEGPQQIEESYPSQFYVYPWRAMNPDTRLPEDNRHEWLAPGGRGDHSLPADFQPATIELLDGARVMFVVGPKFASLKHRFVRHIGGSRMFDMLPARLSEPVAVDYEKWINSSLAASSGS